MKNLIPTKIEKIRAQISELQDEREWLQDALLPAGEMHERCCKIIDDLGDRFSNNINAFDFDAFIVTGQISELQNTATINLGSLLCGLFSAQIKISLKEKIDEMNLEAGPPQADRLPMIADVNKRLRDLETMEESLIVQASGIGQIIPRRQDTNPAVILEYSDD